MRWLGLALIVAACGGKEEGALLVLDAPPEVTAARLEIILASAAPDAIERVDRQRTDPRTISNEPVQYYHQRAITGEVSDVGVLDGFAVRLEPNIDIPDPSLIPILIAYDAQGQIVAVGTVMEAGVPAPVEIAEGRVLRFTVAMTATTQTDGGGGVGANEVMAVDCSGFRSGIAWKPSDLQLRLLLPDRAADPDATDASERALDLDCDGQVANDSDCDDLRGEFHVGADEACDGMDFDCDMRLRELVPCTTGTNACGLTTGVGICDDTPGAATNPVTACAAEPECACADGGACSVCSIHFDNLPAGSEVVPCSPSIATHVSVPGCANGCVIEVLKRPDDPFRVTISPPDANMFADKITNLVADKIDIQVESAIKLAAGPNDIVGGIFLAVFPVGGPPSQRSFAIKLHEAASTCDALANTMGCVDP